MDKNGRKSIDGDCHWHQVFMLWTIIKPASFKRMERGKGSEPWFSYEDIVMTLHPYVKQRQFYYRIKYIFEQMCPGCDNKLTEQTVHRSLILKIKNEHCWLNLNEIKLLSHFIFHTFKGASRKRFGVVKFYHC